MKTLTSTKTTAFALLLIAPLVAGCTGQVATTTVQFDFGDRILEADLSHDADTQWSKSHLDAAGRAHAGGYTAFDQLVQWSETQGVSIEVGRYEFGFCLDRVDGVPEIPSCQTGSTAFWSLAVNGQDSMVGMTDALLSPGDAVAWTLVRFAAPTDDPGGSNFTLGMRPVVPTRNETVFVQGEVTAASQLSFVLDHAGEKAVLPGMAADGVWGLEVVIPHGNSTLHVTADDGVTTATANASLVRLANGTVQVHFKGLPGHTDRNDEVWFDPDSAPSASHYVGQGVPHPGYANVHDLMVAWTSQTGVPVVYKPHSSFGSQVMQIDGVGDPTLHSSVFWCYTVNGATASLGITGQEFHPGDAVAWHLGSC